MFLQQLVNLWTGKVVNVDVHVAYGANVCPSGRTRATTLMVNADSRPDLVTNQY